VIALLLGLGLAGCGSDNDMVAEGNVAAPPVAPAQKAPAAGKLDRSHAGTPAPDLGFEDGDGRPITMAAFRGRPALVNLWATWCAPCIVEMPSLDALAVREGDALQVVALSQDVGGREPVERFFAERNFRALDANLDREMAFMFKLKLDSLPATILYDAQGKEVWRMIGPADWASDEVARLLEEGRQGRPRVSPSAAH
jgi:thiol-disulfide isomerase/thioredoxin